MARETRRRVSVVQAPVPDVERVQAAVESATEAVAEAEMAAAQEFPETDAKDPRIGHVLPIGTRHVAFEDGEYRVDPETGVVLKRL